MSDEEVLSLRFCNLPIAIEGSWLEKHVGRLHEELQSRGIGFHPPCFLADEWLCPDGEPVIGIPFFLAHPRLKSLEMKMMFEVEGGDPKWCMKLLRHETGHALNYAYGLYRRKRWKELFGPFNADYPDRYKYRPYSKRFVQHLDEWYAQYHPDEDFAETFAVWLAPRSNWRRRYKGWQALEKLEYVDELMAGIGNTPPKKPEGERYWDVSRMRSTLRTYYKKKREFYAEYYPDFHDHMLLRIFSKDGRDGSIPAYDLVRRYRKTMRHHVAGCTGEKKYIIDGIFSDIHKRCRELKLHCVDENDSVVYLTAYVTSLTMNYLYTGRFKKEKL
jgi:hypothetical protein